MNEGPWGPAWCLSNGTRWESLHPFDRGANRGAEKRQESPQAGGNTEISNLPNGTWGMGYALWWYRQHQNWSPPAPGEPKSDTLQTRLPSAGHCEQPGHGGHSPGLRGSACRAHASEHAHQLHDGELAVVCLQRDVARASGKLLEVLRASLLRKHASVEGLFSRLVYPHSNPEEAGG